MIIKKMKIKLTKTKNLHKEKYLKNKEYLRNPYKFLKKISKMIVGLMDMLKRTKRKCNSHNTKLI